VRLVFELDALERALTPALRRLAPELGASAVSLALYGGEDYALLATGPAKARPAEARVIGAVQAGQGVWLANSKGGRLIRAGRGFEHAAQALRG
jgi:thiamine-monophosphate kinase